MISEDNFITNNSTETLSLGEGFAKKIKTGDFLAFYGNLGSGKTTFIQGLAKGLGIKRRIISPTFIIVRSYKIQNSKSFYHIDLYRTQTIDDLLGLGIDEIIKDNKNIVALEWAEKMGKFLPRKRIDITFAYLDEGRRQIKILRHE